MCFFFSSRGAVYLLSFKQTKGETVVHKLNCKYVQALSYLHIATIDAGSLVIILKLNKPFRN